jgi:streptomycin 6-kinase
MAPIDVPPPVVNKARSAGAADWLAALPRIVAELEQAWGMTVGEPYSDATEAWVAAADLDDGRRAVVKVCVPRPGDAAQREATVLRIVGGVGCAALLAADDQREAILVERLGSSLYSAAAPVEERHRVLAGLAASIWRPAASVDPADRDVLPSGAAKAEWLIEQIALGWEELARPCSRAAVDHAVACAERRRAAHDPGRAVLVHADVHQWNALRVDDPDGGPPGWKLIDPDGGPPGWKLIDPDGLLAEPEYDLGVIMREDPVELEADLAAGDPRRRARTLADLTGCDETAIWEWGVVERVSTGLICRRIGLQPVGDQMLRLADRLAPPRSPRC